MPLEISLIESGVGGSAPQTLSVDVPTAGIVASTAKIAMGTIEGFDPDAIYHVVIRFDGDYSSATSSNPITVLISLLIRWARPVAGTFKHIPSIIRATSASAYLSHLTQAANAVSLDAKGTLYLYSYSSNAYSRLGAGTYTATIYKLYQED